MASKKNYLIKVWQTASKKKIDDSDVDKDKHSGFDLLQERIIKSYENNIKNLYVPKGFRSTYEETDKEETPQSKTSTAR